MNPRLTFIVVGILTLAFPFGLSAVEPPPKFLWANHAGGLGLLSGIRGAAADGGGNVYVTGHFDSLVINFGTNKLTNFNTDVLQSDPNKSKYVDRPTDIFLAKYDANGSLQWLEHGGGRDSDNSFSCAVDALSNVYVTGTCLSTNAWFGNTNFTNTNGLGIYVAKYDPLGKLLWLRSSARGHSNCSPNSLVVDTRGNVCISGIVLSSNLTFGDQVLSNSQKGYRFDTFLVKYATSGELLWTRQIRNTSQMAPGRLATDAADNIYFAGSFYGSAGFEKGNLPGTGPRARDHAFFVKYTPDGNVQWAHEAAVGAESACSGITVDQKGNIVICGIFMNGRAIFGFTTLETNAAWRNMFIAKYDMHGTLLWAKTAIGEKNDPGATKVIADGEDSYIMAGLGGSSTNLNFGRNCVLSLQSYRPFIVKYDGAGEAVWARSMEGETVMPIELALASTNGLWLAGSYRKGARLDNISLTNTIPGPDNDDFFVARMKLR